MARLRRTRMPASQMRKKTWITVKDEVDISSTGNAVTLLQMAPPELVTQEKGESTSVGFGLFDVDDNNALFSTLPPESTILRIRGELSVPDTVGVGTFPLEIFEDWAFGAGVTSMRAMAGGSAPTPHRDPDWDGWMFLRHGFDASTSPGTGYNSLMVDIKAKRKIQDGDSLFFNVSNQLATTVTGDRTLGGETAILHFRILVLLP